MIPCALLILGLFALKNVENIEEVTCGVTK
jgi:hypothetical protein